MLVCFALVSFVILDLFEATCFIISCTISRWLKIFSYPSVIYVIFGCNITDNVDTVCRGIGIDLSSFLLTLTSVVFLWVLRLPPLN